MNLMTQICEDGQICQRFSYFKRHVLLYISSSANLSFYGRFRNLHHFTFMKCLLTAHVKWLLHLESITRELSTPKIKVFH